MARGRPSKLAELSRTEFEFDQELFSHSAYNKFFCDIRNKSAVINVLRQNETIFDIQVGFLAGPPLIVLSVRLDSKSHQKGSQCQNFLRVWHLFVFWADQ